MRILGLIAGLAVMSSAAAAKFDGSAAQGPNFSFGVSDLKGCSDFHIEFTQGKPPYSLHAFAANNDVYNWTNIAYSKSAIGGTATLKLPYNQFASAGNTFASEIMFVMSDATGFGSGGVSDFIKIGPGPTGCAGRPVERKFNWALLVPDPDKPDPLGASDLNGQIVRTCEEVQFIWNEEQVKNAGSPVGEVHFVGIVQNTGVWQPMGLSSTGFCAYMKEEAGLTVATTLPFYPQTSVIFAAWDSEGNSGGASMRTTIGESDTNRCLQKYDSAHESLSEKPLIPWTQVSAAAKVVNNADGRLTNATKIGVGVGAALAATILIAVAIFFIWRCSKRRRVGKAGPVDLFEDVSETDQPDHSEPKRFHEGQQVRDTQSVVMPFIDDRGSLAPSSSGYSSLPLHRSPPGSTGYSESALSPRGSDTMEQRLTSKAARAGIKPGEFGQPVWRHHEDGGAIAVEGPVAGANDIINVPPNYNPEWSEPGSARTTQRREE